MIDNNKYNTTNIIKKLFISSFEILSSSLKRNFMALYEYFIRNINKIYLKQQKNSYIKPLFIPSIKNMTINDTDRISKNILFTSFTVIPICLFINSWNSATYST